MKSVKKVLKARLMKRAAAVMLSGVLLCGQGMSVAAATASHVCQFYQEYDFLYLIQPTGDSHQYISGYKNYDDGRREPVYSKCTFVNKYYKRHWKCAICEATLDEFLDPIRGHLACGQ